MGTATGLTDPILALEIGEWRSAQRLLRDEDRCDAIRLVCREQGGLRQLRRQAESSAGLTGDRRILVLAVIEAACWVEFDLETWTPKSPPDEEIAVLEAQIAELADRRRDAFLCSTSNLQRLALPTGWGMTRFAWDRADQYRGLRQLALKRIVRPAAAAVGRVSTG
ncbi:hypothetical protein [Streptomyces sp. SID13031]|uniref:hypothetical protein n=1 Tax=Streptomyces sp. SID13031 TaxID=2706046 RepID=UPI0013C7B2D5|nr:hypothetical protein [Streptomyces sp. SID13031]NEA35519.1 hypothetical protein [Streptomyces sp. SID13031]